MSFSFLGVAGVIALHDEQIREFGGAAGLRDEGLLQSAVFRAEQKAHYDEGATVGSLAAALGWGLVKNHAFIDGKANRLCQHGRVPGTQRLPSQLL